MNVIPKQGLTPEQIKAIEEAIYCLREVHTGENFEVECWLAADALEKQFGEKE